MNELENFRKLLDGNNQEWTPFMPLTMMFAADLIGRSYREYASNARIQTEGQLKVAEIFGTSHISAISDPAVEASDLGAAILVPENAPPALLEENALLKDKKSLVSLNIVKPEEGRRMSNRLEAVRLLSEKSAGNLIVEGWVEGPCAEAADLRGINHLMMDFYDDPDFVGDLMDFITEQEILFALRQLDQGAHIIGIGDAASSLIGPDLYGEFVFPRTGRYVKAIHEAGGLVRLHICGDINALYSHIAELDVDMIDLDSMCSIGNARKILGKGTAISGNLNPVSELKDSIPDRILSRLTDCRAEAEGRYVIAAGCEIPRGTPFDNMEAMSRFKKL